MVDALTCPCGSDLAFKLCCEPLISQTAKADTPEKLMRSRFTAYSEGSYDYILNTYAASSRPNISAIDLKNDNQNTLWLSLAIHKSSSSQDTGEVEFTAYYKVNNDVYCMHENSRFIKQDGVWLYLNGDIFEDSGLLKIGRNEACICGSGKKYKRCCQA